MAKGRQTDAAGDCCIYFLLSFNGDFSIRIETHSVENYDCHCDPGHMGDFTYSLKLIKEVNDDKPDKDKTITNHERT